MWLPNDSNINQARILSFGYNAGYGPGQNRTVTNIADFAKDLLNEMQFGQDEEGCDLKIGDVPIIFVVHSMGGLVVKKAYILGQNDMNYNKMVHSITAMVFLGTPHRGSGFAEMLNRILLASFQTAKGFIADLDKQSSALADLNETFRHFAEKLTIWSFYETKLMRVAGQRLMIVEKDSAILGYPAELSVPLDADHKSMCKYSSPTEANYLSVRNALRSIVGKFVQKAAQEVGREVGESDQVEKLLAITPDEDDDFDSFYSHWVPGTCDWLLQESSFKTWSEQTPESRVIWYSAPPGTGKSVLSAFIIKHLRDQGLEPQHFFFRYGDQKRRTISTCLQRIAFQIAKLNQDFYQSLQSLAEEGLQLAKADAKLIWHKIFESLLFRSGFEQPLYWIIDGLDEADSPNLLVDLLQTLPKASSCVRLLIISRKLSPLSVAFDRLCPKVPVLCIENSGPRHTATDIALIVETEIRTMSGTEEFKSEVRDSIVSRANGNLLWVRLVLQEVLACYTEEDVRETLKDLPGDMTLLYQRMEEGILNSPRKGNIALAKSLLRWAVCCRRSLRLEELAGALPHFLDLRRTINDVCGQFIVISETGSVGLIHQTARDYLTRTSQSDISINIAGGHEELCLKALAALSDPELRLRLIHHPQSASWTHSFAAYAATSWTYHLRQSRASETSIDATAKFLRTPAVLTWIHALAVFGQLDGLVRAAKDFSATAATMKSDNAVKNPLLQELTELNLLERWSVDLVKVVAKFRKPLLDEPRTIYKTVPAICPAQSVMYEQFYRSNAVEVSVTGVPPAGWNDNLVRIVLPVGDRGAHVTATGSYLAVLGTSGTTYVWNSASFLEVCTVQHKEPVTAICLNKRGDRLATYGLKSTKCWSLPSGELCSSTPNVPDVKAMTLEYASNDQKLLAGTDDKIVRTLNVIDPVLGWEVLCSGPSSQNSDLEKSLINTPVCMRFNESRTQVALSYRGSPLTVWSLAEDRCIGRSKRSRAFRSSTARPSTNWFSVDRFTFNPVTGHVIGVYKDGCVFKWHPLTDDNDEVRAVADEVDVSPDGRLFVTSDTEGNIAIWSFSYMSKIYQLSSSDLVDGLAFSPNAQRFYDIRGRSVNAWEPNAVMRFAEREASQTDTSSEEQASDITHTSEALLVPFEPITTIGVNSKTAMFCAGNDEGLVHAFCISTGQKITIAEFLNFQCVSHLAISTNGKHIAAADLSGEIVVKRLNQQPSKQKSAAFDVISLTQPRVDLHGHGIDQLLMNAQGSLLLISNNHLSQVWSTEHAKIVASSTFETGKARKFLQHPTDPALFLGFGVTDVTAYYWNNLEEVTSIQYCEATVPGSERVFSHLNGQRREHTFLPPLNSTDSKVIKAMVSQKGQRVLVQIKEIMDGRSRRRILIFDSQALNTDGTIPRLPLLYYALPQIAHRAIDIPLEVLSNNQLAFLDGDLWLCTLNLEAAHRPNAIKRHYFVPRDWANTECSELSCMLDNGTLLYPKDADVAIISYGFDD